MPDIPGRLQAILLGIAVLPLATATSADDVDWMSPYAGPGYLGDHPVDATTLDGKVICGYQGWFRTPGDRTGQRWRHYANRGFRDLTIEMWPDMQEFTDAEKYAVPGWTHADGRQAFLFSSANRRTVLRHFQWMQAYGIHGVALQRFLVDINERNRDESCRVPAHAREAAHRTGRTYFIMYDLSGLPTIRLIDAIRDDWRDLVDRMEITDNDRYLHHDGEPVVGIFGFYSDRFSADTAHSILDVFQDDGPYRAFVVGSGEWWWRTESAPGWPDVFRRMDAWIPWNVGHYSDHDAATDQWPQDKRQMDEAGVLYMPLVYPGFGWDNLRNRPPGSTLQPRRRGRFMWPQFLAAREIGAKAVYVAMFDELDEGTAIFKVASDVPVNHYFVTLEGLPSDFYLLMTGCATDIINRSLDVPDEMPDFAARSQPPVPEVLAPANGERVKPPLSISWSAVQHPSGIRGYELEVDGVAMPVATTERSLELPDGSHVIRVRARNGLGNSGGYSEAVEFTVGR